MFEIFFWGGSAFWCLRRNMKGGEKGRKLEKSEVVSNFQLTLQNLRGGRL